MKWNQVCSGHCGFHRGRVTNLYLSIKYIDEAPYICVNHLFKMPDYSQQLPEIKVLSLSHKPVFPHRLYRQFTLPWDSSQHKQVILFSLIYHWAENTKAWKHVLPDASRGISAELLFLQYIVQGEVKLRIAIEAHPASSGCLHSHASDSM